MTTRDVTFWLQLEPEFDRRGGDVRVSGLKAVRVTQRYPDPPKAGCDVVKLTLRVPTSRLLPLAPDLIVLPDLPTTAQAFAEAELTAEGDS